MENEEILDDEIENETSIKNLVTRDKLQQQ